MFFRRMFTRKHSNDGDNYNTQTNNNSNNEVNTIVADKNNNKRSDFETAETNYRKYNIATAPALATTATTSSKHTMMNTQARASASAMQSTAIQLTPLWEHILRTRKLPESISIVAMFHEFHERLRDPEWQVRQHALRVLVDVLVVLRAKADSYMEPIIAQIVENLGHPAPTVRKGALDCLRVYLAETAIPDRIMLQILDIGLNQKITNEPFGGRLTCGVMLSLPALVQSTLHTVQRHYILRSTIDMLVQKMGQVTHQEITLKVFLKLRELLGEAEFEQYMSHGAYREFELLCSVYGLDETLAKSENCKRMASGSSANWQTNPNKQPATATCWHTPPTPAANNSEVLECPEHAKVIMETEIKINDDTLTMRILEAKDDDCTETEAEAEASPKKPKDTISLDDEVVSGRLKSAQSQQDAVSILQLLSDSDFDLADVGAEGNREKYFSIVTPSTPSRTPKRVTFGGEVVKMRTPDSDAASTNNNRAKAFVELTNSNSNSNNDTNSNSNSNSSEDNIAADSNANTNTAPNTSTENKTAALSLEIPNDNTKPLSRPGTAQSAKRETSTPTPTPPPTSTTTTLPASPSSSAATGSPLSPNKRKDSQNSLSPKSPFKRLIISPVDSLISPKTPHKEIEVLHNLQRDPSPVYVRSGRRQSTVEEEELRDNKALQSEKKTAATPGTPPPATTWEELDIVDYETLLELRSGNWRLRLQGIMQLEEALRSSENLALVQPCLASLLRTLLSSERNTDVAEAKRRLLINLITRLPLDNLEDRTVQILTGLCRQGGAGANRVCKALMQRLPPAVIVVKLISDEFLHAKSSRFREHALQMVMYALITFPSTCFDTSLCITNAVYAALNRKRRVRQAALDVLAILGQITTARGVLEITQQIAATRDEGAALVSAVKARLARKQLPVIAPDGSFQYALRVPSPQIVEEANIRQIPMDPDIEWITAGIGSVSPTSLKRRAYKHRSSSQQSFRCLPQNPHLQVGSSRALDETFTRFPTDFSTNGSSSGGTQEDNHNHSYNMQQMMGNNMNITYGIQTKKSNADYLSFNSRRMPAKSCSDSSMDGRSSDSTYTNSSGGSVGSGIVATNATAAGISGRFTRQTVNSRFPAMDRIDLNTTYLRVHKPPVYYPGMGAYAHLQQQQMNMNSTYTKVNYDIGTQQTRRRPQQQAAFIAKQQSTYQYQQPPQLQQQPPPKYHMQAKENFKQIEIQSNELNNDNENLDGTYTICTGMAAAKTNMKHTQQQQQQYAGNTGRRFVNVEKFIMQSNKSSQTNGNGGNQNVAAAAASESKHTTPVSIKSTAYSQKSTASAKSNDEIVEKAENTVEPIETIQTIPTPTPTSAKTDEEEPACSTPTTTFEGTLNENGDNNDVGSESPTKWSTGIEVLQLEDVLDDTTDAPLQSDEETKLKRNDSLISLHSKTESIKTQLEDTPPALSRTQSNKSLVIEEELEESNTSFMVVEADIDVQSIGKEIEVDKKSCNSLADATISPAKSHAPASRLNSPTIVELKSLSRRNSMIKSMESLYERRSPPTKQESSSDNTTETSSQSSQLNASTGTILPIKPQHTPLKQKSKTTHFLKNSRRVSPVKQSIKMSQPELFPSSLTKFEKPRDAILQTFEQLDSSSWEVIVQGLKSIVRLMRHHPDYLDNQMHMVCIQLTRSVRNLRSQVSRAACQASAELFTLKMKTLEQECDDLVCALLHRTADTNRFLRADATRALESMCDNLPPVKVLNVLSTKGAMHANALVRTTGAKLLHRLVERLGYDKIYNMAREQRDKFFLTGANLLLEGSLETRSYAKSLFKILAEHPSFNRLVLEIIPARTYRNLEKTFKNIAN